MEETNTTTSVETAIDKLKSRVERMNNTNRGGVGFCGLLFITFLVLKLTHVINWSWWWITAPLWGPIALVLGIVGLVLLVAIIVALCSTDK